ncbi:multidrug ABC transporter permease [Sporosarcina sp. NCCP-2222]|uniref:ABC transporter ATP-binding protein n=1 Tax=Sporosarcina sp. NCCP-2222 TaxID=2935073 RepID=UPI00208CCDE2|nr:ABC transporter ATP-binding protein [Sporosarcina sp. NCCP-2222]GKV57346.1 multidrug ABC transporter permease [Sporosarcina sp. NCCP-2222]
MASNEKKLRKQAEKGIWKSYFRLMFKAKLPWGWIIFVSALYILSATVTLLFPDFSSKVMTGVLKPYIIWGTVGLIIADVIMSGLVRFFNKLLVAKIDVSYRSLIWERVIKSPLRFFDSMKPTTMITRITTDASKISTVLGSYLPSLAATVYGTVGVVAVVFSYNWRLGLSVVVYIPLYLLFNAYYGKWNFRAFKETYNRLSILTQFLSERLMSVPLIKTFVTEKKEDELGHKSLQYYFKANMRRYIIMWVENPINGILSITSDILVILYGGYLVKAGYIQLNDWVAFFMYIGMLWGMLGSYLMMYVEIKKSQGATDRIAALMDGDLEVNEGKVGIEKLDKDILFKDVAFSYGDKPVLGHVDLTIPVGKVTALVGPSGSGKSTIFSLLQRFYEPDAGEIFVGDTSISDIHLKDWRNLFAGVAQDSPMLSGTIRENILYGVNWKVSEFELAEAARKANALDFINGFKDGFDTYVGEAGSNLSGGQRQRIAIARAILRNSDILLLDEATASLDSQSEKAIQDAMEQLMRGRTTIMISHDLSNVHHADQIIVLSGGTVDGAGTHEELLKTNELYRHLVQLHTGSSAS